MKQYNPIWLFNGDNSCLLRGRDGILNIILINFALTRVKGKRYHKKGSILFADIQLHDKHAEY